MPISLTKVSLDQLMSVLDNKRDFCDYKNLRRLQLDRNDVHCWKATYL